MLGLLNRLPSPIRCFCSFPDMLIIVVIIIIRMNNQVSVLPVTDNCMLLTETESSYLPYLSITTNLVALRLRSIYRHFCNHSTITTLFTPISRLEKGSDRGIYPERGTIPQSRYNKLNFFFTKSWKLLDFKKLIAGRIRIQKNEATFV